ncbi:hypothetical protein HNQ63_001220 [Wenzhouxiangella marina]|uniref:Uncharacterized protein n=1 Tax=Wenzhouxiangella marina TaxID=1579979 RepID=A0A0K0XUW6_9GAMM|nr:hypothetical protein WM2015_1085 [Wenzhouxiangella marina]MBB6086783.1 hypothetical protein [Wenzhouxiangella marina]
MTMFGLKDLTRALVVAICLVALSGCAAVGATLNFIAEVGECYAGVDCVMDDGGFDGVTSDDGSSAAYYQSAYGSGNQSSSSGGAPLNCPAGTRKCCSVGRGCYCGRCTASQ